MENLIISDLYDVFGTYASSMVFEGIINFHFPEFFDIDKVVYGNKFGIKIDFYTFLVYAITHEEIHIVLYKIGEDTNSLDCEIACLAMCHSLNIKILLQTKLKGD